MRRNSEGVSVIGQDCRTVTKHDIDKKGIGTNTLTGKFKRVINGSSASCDLRKVSDIMYNQRRAANLQN